MAIDATGKPMMSTTGPLNTRPRLFKAPKIGRLELPPQTKPRVQQPPQEVVQTTEPQINLQNLKDDDKRILDIHLTPSFKRVLSQVFGKDLFPGMGSNEPTVMIPAKLVAEKFGSIDNFRSLIKEDDNVPPSQGNMTSPQTT